MQWVWYAGACVLLYLALAARRLIRFRRDRRLNPLIEAVKQGDTKEVRALLAQGADPNARETQVVYRKWLLPYVLEMGDVLSKPALMLAAAGGHKDIVELLLESGAEVDATAAWGSTALMWSVDREGDARIAQLLIDHGADVNAQGFEPPLITAAAGQRRDLVELLLNHGADVNIRDDEGYTALMEPADYGYQEVVEVLIAAGIDVNARNSEGFTALGYAKKSKQMQIVDLLVRAGGHE
jgi:ankyrin repeat protein